MTTILNSYVKRIEYTSKLNSGMKMLRQKRQEYSDCDIPCCYNHKTTPVKTMTRCTRCNRYIHSKVFSMCCFCKKITELEKELSLLKRIVEYSSKLIMLRQKRQEYYNCNKPCCNDHKIQNGDSTLCTRCDRVIRSKVFSMCCFCKNITELENEFTELKRGLPSLFVGTS